MVTIEIPDARGTGRAYRLKVERVRAVLEAEDTGAAYEVAIEPDGTGSCTCPSYLHRHAQDGTDCKHLAALRSKG